MLTDEELMGIRNRAKLNSNRQIDPMAFARDIERAVLAKAQVPAQAIPEGSASVIIDDLKRIHRDLDACQKVIWLAGGFDPAYCKDAQESLRLIDSALSASPKP